MNIAMEVGWTLKLRSSVATTMIIYPVLIKIGFVEMLDGASIIVNISLESWLVKILKIKPLGTLHI